jgi:hypothetical protein
VETNLVSHNETIFSQFKSGPIFLDLEDGEYLIEAASLRIRAIGPDSSGTANCSVDMYLASSLDINQLDPHELALVTAAVQGATTSRGDSAFVTLPRPVKFVRDSTGLTFPQSFMRLDTFQHSTSPGCIVWASILVSPL